MPKPNQMPTWFFDKLGPDDMERNPVSEEFFAGGTRLEAVIRESLQNSLDAADEGSDPVEVRIYFSGDEDKLPSERLKPYFEGGKQRFEDPKNGLVSPEAVLSGDCRFLVIEDFHTTGLTGIIDERPLNDDASHRNDWNYYNYFFRENGSTKLGAGTLGSWGAGKCVFQRASRLKCSFSYSVRNNYEPRAFVVGKATLQFHTDASHNTWKPDGWFGIKNEQNGENKKHKLPITDSEFITKFKEDFNIMRQDEPGMSIVIPYISFSEDFENEGAEFNQTNLVKSVLRNFLVAIFEGKLKVVVQVGKCGTKIVIDKTSVGAYGSFLPNPEDRDALVTSLHHKLILTEFAETQKITLLSPGDEPSWGKTMFSEDQLKSLRKLLQEEKKPCRITVPVPIRKKTADGKVSVEESSFTVLLERHDLQRSLPPVFYRVGLLIDAVATTNLNNYIAAVLIERGALAELLVAAEPPSHNKWNYDTDHVVKAYDKPRKHIRFVSYAVREIINTLATFDQKRSYDPLSDVFFIKKNNPETHNNDGNKAAGGNDGNDGGNTEPPQTEAERKRNVVISEIDGNTKGIKVKPGEGLSMVPDEKFPIVATFFVGYDTFGGLDWSPNDFMLDNSDPSGVHISVMEGSVEANGQGNKIILFIKDKAPFCVTVTGFDPNRDIIVEKLRYDYKKMEVEDGVSV